MRSVIDSLSRSRNTMVIYEINGKTIKVQVPEKTSFNLTIRQRLDELESTAMRLTATAAPDLVRSSSAPW